MLISLAIVAGLIVLAWMGLTALYTGVIRQQAATPPELATDVPEQVLERLAFVEQWSEDNGYQWVGCHRLAAVYNGIWRNDRMLLVARVAEAGEPDVVFNSVFTRDRELITLRRRLDAAHAMPAGIVHQHWLNASIDELHQFHAEGVAYLQTEAGWGQPIDIPEGDALLAEVRRSQERWIAFVRSIPLWPLRFTAVLLRAPFLPTKRSARQRLPLERARQL